MEDLEKLRHMAEHWIEHNEGHLEVYLNWAGRARELGKPELASILEEIAHETKKMDALFRKAKEAAS